MRKMIDETKQTMNTAPVIPTTRPAMRLTVILFLVLLCGLSVLFFALPDRAFSEHENRYLARVPGVTAEKIFSGKTSRETEDYISDQFPLRDHWIVAQAAAARWTGRRDNNGIYFAGEEDGALTETFWNYDRERYAKNLDAAESYAKAAAGNGEEVYFVPVPNAVAVRKGALPPLAPDLDQAQLIEEAKLRVPDATVVDVLSTLREEAAERQLYYRTDHHMTTAGSFIVYRKLMQTMGTPPRLKEDFSRVPVTSEFRGTLYNKSGAWWTEPDTIWRWDRKEAAGAAAGEEDADSRQKTSAASVSVTILPSGEQYDTLYNEAALSTSDPFQYFLYGNQPVTVIRTGAAAEAAGSTTASDAANTNTSDEANTALRDTETRKILLIKDSYAHEIVPFLAEHFDEIHMIDLRYYHESIAAYKAANGLDTTIILYNVKNLTEDEYFPLINR